MRLGPVPLDAFLSADMHLSIANLEPEAASLLEGSRLSDLPDSEYPAVESPRFRHRICGDCNLHVIDADDHPPSPAERESSSPTLGSPTMAIRPVRARSAIAVTV